MSQRFNFDRRSFEQVLCAASLIQQLNRKGRNDCVPDQNAPQPLSSLVDAQLAIETGSINLQGAMNRVVGLALKLSRATGAATWLLSGHEFVCRAETGSGANDERLRMEALSQLASIRERSDHPVRDPRESNQWNPPDDADHDPGSVKSLLVAPIFHGRSIAGALVLYSDELNAFTEHDATNARLLSGLLTHAVAKAAEAELREKVSLERATMLQAIDQLIPALRELEKKEKKEFHKPTNSFPSLIAEFEPGFGLTAISQEPGDVVLQSSDSPTEVGVVAHRTELELRDCLMPQKGEGETGDVADDCSPPAYLAPEPTRARESICVPGSPNISTLRIGVLTEFPFWRVRSSAAIPLAILLVIFVFLFLITTASPPSNAAAATSETSAAAKVVPTSGSSPDLHQRSGLVSAHQLSHMQITDPDTSIVLLNLSRYEIVGLRRRAMYGDDSAAFLLGMAYETGHLVPQSCVKAGEWVTRSAEEGNAAAQYNLGLRYSNGDGEPVNQEVGMGWLRKAAAQKHSQAELALESMP
jgi:hypothetical protein